MASTATDLTNESVSQDVDLLDAHVISQSRQDAIPVSLYADGEPLPDGPSNVEGPPASPSVFHSVQLPQGNRIFLDICSGMTRPLSAALLNMGADVLSYDLLLRNDHNLLDDSSFEQLLRVCSSGQVGYGGASPSCGQYSRLKLRNDAGLKALRTPEFLDGVPGLSASELQKVQESHTMLIRCVLCLTLIFHAGGHVHLEQPPSAMSWLEPAVQQFLTLISAFCTFISACRYGANWYKSWLFAGSYAPISQLGMLCNHPPGSHVSIAGQLDSNGEFLSKQTVCYPTLLAERFAGIVQPLLSHHSHDWQWCELNNLMPIKPVDAPPFSLEVGGGLPSHPDWSQSERTEVDHLKLLRQSWRDRIIQQRLDRHLLAYLANPDISSPPFSAEILAPFVQEIEEFINSSGLHGPSGTISPWRLAFCIP